MRERERGKKREKIFFKKFFLKVNEKQMEKESLREWRFPMFSAEEDEKDFSHELKTCESSFLSRNEANRIENGIYERKRERDFKMRFLKIPFT